MSRWSSQSRCSLFRNAVLKKMPWNGHPTGKNPCMCNLYTVNTVITYTQSCNNTNRQNNYSTSKLFIEKQAVRCGGCLEQRGTAAVNSQGNPLVVVCARMKRCSSGSPCSSGGLKVDERTVEMAALASFYLGFSELRPIFAVVPEPEAPPAEINKNAGIPNHAAPSPSTSREIAHRTNI